MKKIALFLFAIAALSLFSFWVPAEVHAQDFCNESNNGNNGLVPCGRMCKDLNGDAITCGTKACEKECGDDNDEPCPCYKLKCPCDIPHVLILMRNIYIFMVWKISLPIAGLLIMIGGILYIIGGANPNLHAMAKRILWGTAWALVVILGSYVIIGGILGAIGYTGNWFSFDII